MIHKKILRVKAIPVKSKSLCDKCVYDYKICCGNYKSCIGCEMVNASTDMCYCNEIVKGEPCKHFKRRITVEEI